MSKIRLRTKFLLSLLAISAGLTIATLGIVSYSVEARVRDNIREDLQNSLHTYQTFEKQREKSLAGSAQLLANLPNVRALMTTEDQATIQDASEDVWKLSGSDLLVLANRAGSISGIRTNHMGLDQQQVHDLLRGSLDKKEQWDWWFAGGHLYQVWVQPIYFGTPSENSTIGFLAVGDEITQSTAKDFSNVASSEVMFNFGDVPVASTLGEAKHEYLGLLTRESSKNLSEMPQEIQLGSERYLVAAVALSSGEGPRVFLTVLESLDKATSFLTKLNNILIGLGFVSVMAGSFMVFVISHTFTKPLGNLVSGVRALEKGNFSYALDSSGGDEVAEVTAAFIGMRESLENTQKEQKQLEERLRQAHKMEAVGRLAGGVAHDFNNLLTIIRGNSDLLIDREGADDFHRRCVDQIQKAASRAVSMTRQLLAFSRMQVLQPRLLELNTIVAEMGKMLPRLIGEHIEYSFQPGANIVSVKADVSQIEQVILNLAVNARDAMPGGGKLSVSTANVFMDPIEAAKRPPMTPGHYVLLSVSDSGHGMDDSTKAHIFEPFFTTKEMGKGTGLGLATVYGVVKQSGGFIWVISAPDKGTTFEIYLPQASGKPQAPEVEAKLSAAPRGNETILVVEDEAGVRELASQFLRVKGFTVLEAQGGFEALEVAAQHSGPIHLLLSDMVMPGMNGVDLVCRLKLARPETKVMFMSGYSEYSKAGLGQAPPGTPILQKPFSPASLVAMVHEALGASREQVREATECRAT